MSTDLFQGKYRIPSARLPGYDYGSNGIYFVTVCVRNREHLLGDIDPRTATFSPSEIGQVAIDCWYKIPTFFPFVELDAFQLMPNHLHGILWICKPDERLAGPLPQEEMPNQFGPQRQRLGSILRGYKSGVKMHASTHQIDFGWQARYHDRVVRNANELDRIRTYIDQNPARWAIDRDNPESLYM